MMRVGQKLHPLLPTKAYTRRSAADHRAIINGILWIHRTGAPWDDLPARYGSRGTVPTRFYRWRSQDIWQEILNRLQQTADAANQIDARTEEADLEKLWLSVYATLACLDTTSQLQVAGDAINYYYSNCLAAISPDPRRNSKCDAGIWTSCAC